MQSDDVGDASSGVGQRHAVDGHLVLGSVVLIEPSEDGGVDERFVGQGLEAVRRGGAAEGREGGEEERKARHHGAGEGGLLPAEGKRFYENLDSGRGKQAGRSVDLLHASSVQLSIDTFGFLARQFGDRSTKNEMERKVPV